MFKTLLILIIFSGLLNLGCGETSTLDSAGVTDTEDQIILSYLDQRIITWNFRGQVFSAYYLFDRTSSELYIWAYTKEYYIAASILHYGAGRSGPLVLTVQSRGEELVITGHINPRDGLLYKKDLKVLFPPAIQNNLLAFQGSDELQNLGRKAEARARAKLG